MKNFLLFIALTFFSIKAISQSAGKADTLQGLFGEVFKNYPKLANVKIGLKFSNQSSTLMSARPAIKSFFSKKLTYNVFVSTNTKYEVFLDTLSTDCIRGWFAHELGHIIDYKKRTRVGIVFFGIKYFLSGKFRKRAERFADEQAILHGYGCELILGVEAQEGFLKPSTDYLGADALRQLFERHNKDKK